jgi:hypothetical protein
MKIALAAAHFHGFGVAWQGHDHFSEILLAKELKERAGA